MMEEYNHQISFRFDPLSITKISYVVNSRKDATIKITRGDNPLNLIVHPNFEIRTLGFSEWLEVHALASKKSKTSNNLLLNLIPPTRVMPIQGLVINKPESGIFFINGNTDLGFQRESEFYQTPTTKLIRIQKQIKVDSEIAREMFSRMNYVIEARKIRLTIVEPLSDGLRGKEAQLSAKHQLAVKGLFEYKASKSNIRCIQVNDIVKEVEDYLKTYSSARMDIS
ncbi:hypothetical protein Tco_1538882 [Tanacetum coccineum]